MGLRMVRKEEIWSVKKYSQFLYDVVKSDNQGLIAVGGRTGVGKSTWLSKVMMKYGEVSGRSWNFNNMTWSRDELIKWIDGENKDDEVDPNTGCRPGQKPEYSALMADEIIQMFYISNRFDTQQQKAIATLNMSRDRHLVIGGCVPNFWLIDSAMRERFDFYVFVRSRGEAWVFKKEENPFNKDPWNQKYNEKIFRDSPNHPWKSHNYLCTIYYDDWEGDMREEYYKIRNKKRLSALKDLDRKEENETQGTRKSRIACGNIINHLETEYGYTDTKIAEIAGVIADRTVAAWANLAIEHYSKYQKN